jgi:putative heme iron utilization protein
LLNYEPKGRAFESLRAHHRFIRLRLLLKKPTPLDTNVRESGTESPPLEDEPVYCLPLVLPSCRLGSTRLPYHFGNERKHMSPNDPSTRQHASTGPASPQLPEPTHAERVRTLMSLVQVGTLSTQSRKHTGFPFGSLMPFALDSTGRPIFLISNMAMHTQNLKADSRCSLFVTQASAEGDPLGAARATLVGNAEPVPEHDLPSVRETYLSRHENSRYWIDFTDFGFFRLQPIDIYYVGGFGVMGWVQASDFEAAAPDPLAEAAPGILAHMNADHIDAMILLARSHSGLEATEATITSVDRLGFSLRLKTDSGMKGTRINFLHEVATPQETRAALVELVRQARTSG